MNRFFELNNELESYKQIRFQAHRDSHPTSKKYASAQAQRVTSRSQIAEWIPLIKLMAPKTIADELRRRKIEIQDIFSFPKVKSNTINLDYYSVKIDKMPAGYANFQDFFKRFIRLNLNAITHPLVTWKPYDMALDKKRWESNAPNGSVLHLILFLGKGVVGRVAGKMGASEKALVACIDSSPYHWIFATAMDIGFNKPNLHPVCGNRCFGYYMDKQDNKPVIYIKGADRKTIGMAPLIFDKGDEAWRSTQSVLVRKIKAKGGDAHILATKQFEYDWEDVKKLI